MRSNLLWASAPFLVLSMTACGQESNNSHSEAVKPHFLAAYAVEREMATLSSEENRRTNLYDAKAEDSETIIFAVDQERFRSKREKLSLSDNEVGADSELQKLAQRLDEAGTQVGVAGTSVEDIEEINQEEVLELDVATTFENAKNKQKLETSERKVMRRPGDKVHIVSKQKTEQLGSAQLRPCQNGWYRFEAESYSALIGCGVLDKVEDGRWAIVSNMDNTHSVTLRIRETQAEGWKNTSVSCTLYGPTGTHAAFGASSDKKICITKSFGMPFVLFQEATVTTPSQNVQGVEFGGPTTIRKTLTHLDIAPDFSSSHLDAEQHHVCNKPPKSSGWAKCRYRGVVRPEDENWISKWD